LYPRVLRSRCPMSRMNASPATSTSVLRQHTSAYVSIRQHTPEVEDERVACNLHVRRTSAYVSIGQHTSAYVSMRQHTAYVSIRQHTAYVSIRHTSAYVSIRACKLHVRLTLLVFLRIQP
jgi:hypothetical protein